MSKNKVSIHFRNLRQLWLFAQAIQAKTIEIRTSEVLLICDCSEKDLKLVEQYEGTVIQQAITELKN